MADVIPPVGQYSAHLQLRDRDWALNARERQQRQQRDAVVEHLPSTVETLQLVTNAHNEAAARAEGKSMHRVAPAAPQAPAIAGRAPLRVTIIQAVFTDFITVKATKLTPSPQSLTNAQKERVSDSAVSICVTWCCMKVIVILTAIRITLRSFGWNLPRCL